MNTNCTEAKEAAFQSRNLKERCSHEEALAILEKRADRSQCLRRSSGHSGSTLAVEHGLELSCGLGKVSINHSAKRAFGAGGIAI
jgi:hypothetical protein